MTDLYTYDLIKELGVFVALLGGVPGLLLFLTSLGD